MLKIGQRGIRHLQRFSTASFTTVSASSIEKGQNRVVDASLTLIRERAKLKVLQSFILSCLYDKNIIIYIYIYTYCVGRVGASLRRS